MSDVQIRDGLAAVTFDRFGLTDYDLFLRAKTLPESQTSYDWETDHYTVSTPARFASLLGVADLIEPIERLPLNRYLFDYQRWIVDRALTNKRFAVWVDTGLGKGIMLLEWCRQVQHLTGRRVLILEPLAVIPQLMAEARRFYDGDLPIERIDTREALEGWCTQPDPAIGIVNPEKFIPGIMPELRYLGGLAFDECFPAGTLVDTPSGQKRIENCRVGDIILNASGADAVSDVHRREVTYAARIAVGGSEITSSPNHPVFTQRGWVCAQDLVPGDSLMATGEAVRMVREAIRSQVSVTRENAVLLAGVCAEVADGTTRGSRSTGRKIASPAPRDGMRVLWRHVSANVSATSETFLLQVLLSELADATTGDSGKGPQSSGGREAWGEAQGLVSLRNTRGGGSSQTDSGVEPDERPSCSRQSLPHIESHAPQTFRAWGKRDWFDSATSDFTGCARTDLGGGISFVTGPADSRLSHALQTRRSAARAENRYRGGWILPRLAEGARRQEGCQAAFTRVDSLEILKPGHPDLERLRDGDGKLYFYDLGGTRHPSFSVNGHLVHNSSTLKSGGGVIKWNLIHSSRGIEYKSSWTATPAPNEAMEYASQASFLEKLRTEGEILWTYFTRDKQGQWRVKPHARDAFYHFMADWSIYLRDPAHFGWADILSTLPPPDVREYRLDITDTQRELMYGFIVQKGGGLFADDRMGVAERAKLAQLARGFLYDNKGTGGRKVARIPSNKPAFIADLVRADVADGRQCLVWTVFDEETEILVEELVGSGIIIDSLSGKMSEGARLTALERFRNGETRCLISKPVLLGYGINMQFCKSMIFSGFDDSFERMYQAIRRCYRFGQTEVVRVHVPYVPELEGLMFANVKKKEAQFMADTEICERNYLDVLRADIHADS